MHTVNGDVPVQRSVLPEGVAGVDATVKKMAQLAHSQWGSKSPHIRALAMNIVNHARVANKDYYGEIVAIHNWVRDSIRYFRDPIGQETLATPEFTAFNAKGGDCLAAGTRVLTPNGYKSIENVEVGDTIAGKQGWTKVLKWWDKGTLPTFQVELSNGTAIQCTADHRFFMLQGGEKTTSELVKGDALPSGPSLLMEGKAVLSDDEIYFLGLYLADGWFDEGRVCIAGKDGFAKEAQKHWVKTWADSKGWAASWHERYIRIRMPKDHPLYLYASQGYTAEDKHIPDCALAGMTTERARLLLNGIMADSYQPGVSKRIIGAEKKRRNPERKAGTCISTISHRLAPQIRLLHRLLGFSVSQTLVVDHGGLGTHPVYRIYPRYYRHTPTKVDSVVEAGIVHVYDIQTQDQGIYLPDNDVVVHNCDDLSTLEIALLGAIGIKSYPVVVGQHPKVFSHVYVHAEVPAGAVRRSGEIIPLDPIMRQWAAGREVPAHKVGCKKTYPHLGNPMTINGDLGAYFTGPSYLDQENSHASELVVPDKVRCYTHRDHTVANGVRAGVSMEGIDGMMGASLAPTGGHYTATSPGEGGTIVEQDGQLVPRGFLRTDPTTGEIMAMRPATAKELGPLGPIQRRRARYEHDQIPRTRAQAIPTLANEMAAGRAQVAAVESPMTQTKVYDLTSVQRALTSRGTQGKGYNTQFLRKPKIVTLRAAPPMALDSRPVPTDVAGEMSLAEDQLAGLGMEMADLAGRMQNAPLAHRENMAVRARQLAGWRDQAERKVLALRQQMRRAPRAALGSPIRARQITAQSATFARHSVEPTATLNDWSDTLKNPWTYAPAVAVLGYFLFRKYLRKTA